MDNVSQFTRDLCDMYTHGGQCIRTGPSSWEILHVGTWNEERASILKRKFPAMVTQIVSSRESLTGFKICLVNQHSSRFWISVTTCAILLVFACAIAGFLKEYTQFHVHGLSHK